LTPGDYDVRIVLGASETNASKTFRLNVDDDGTLALS
jgi:hypothetical protein